MTVHNKSGWWDLFKNNPDKSSYWLVIPLKPFQCYFCYGLVLWEAQAERRTASCWAASQSYQSWALPATAPVHTLVSFFSHISLWSPGSCHTLRIFLLVEIFNFFLTTPLLYTTSCLQEILLFSTSSLWKLGLPSPPHFSQSKHMIKWMMFPWHLNWKIQDMQPLFGHSVIKIYDKATQPLQLTSWRFLLEMFSHTQSPIVYCLLAFMI